MARGRGARISGRITAKGVRLISESDEQLGVVSVREALAMVEKQDMDSVEVSPTAKPFVCKLMGYGKCKCQQTRERDEAKKDQRQVQVKEIRFCPGIDKGDYRIKMRNINRFLASGDKVEVMLRFRGREVAHQQLGAQLLERVKEDLAGVAQIESFLKVEDRQMVMVIMPEKK